ncbi:hypothetical protein LJC25_03605 [Bacteroidales bacterium OttesenSCG-928-K03]|nr:hypothetical protein [Odoribacter sp. OttesenSCG-928-L07]MDL2238748.1 hypothetical protein [Bacteroidales bacterium OttesenSCG-928-L14]MDL2240851.1 hypothetical protein [Bacteroidales bacterium OttesenSCG-928-K22]MDL2242797.1 hypothetical protein [Bacteroidales bacterium OttesenSCG-928-K03]
MKRNITILTLIITTTLFYSCNKFSSYPEDIIGTWISVEQDGKEILTDNNFILTFNSPNIEIYADHKDVENGTKWVVNNPGTFRLEENILFEEGIDENGKSYTYKSRINIDGDLMKFEVMEFILGGVDQNYSLDFTVKRIKDDYKSQFIGLWKGKESTSENDKYWDFFEDGTYDYYYFDPETQSYVNNEDNKGEYFLYGDFMVSNYIGKDDKLTYECCFFTITGNTMKWVSKRENDITATYIMERAESVE